MSAISSTVRLARRGFTLGDRIGRRWEALLDARQKADVLGIDDLPAQPGDGEAGPSLIATMTTSPEFLRATEYFERSPAAGRSLVSPQTQAIIYGLIRHAMPKAVLEIGTFRAGTLEAMCRALAANKKGTVHAIEPFHSTMVRSIIAQWPIELQQFAMLHDDNSMQFFMRAGQGMRFGMALIDGNHDHEFALYDILSAARAMGPGGFLCIDNISQPGPFQAAKDALTMLPGWVECGKPLSSFKTHGYDRERVTIPNTDIAILQAPSGVVIGSRPQAFGQQAFRPRRSFSQVAGVKVLTIDKNIGSLEAQVVIRSFGSVLREVLGVVECVNPTGITKLSFAKPLEVEGSPISVEIILSWSGVNLLHLGGEPAIF